MVQREAGEVVEQVNGKQPASNRLATMLLVNPMSRLPGSIKLSDPGKAGWSKAASARRPIFPVARTLGRQAAQAALMRAGNSRERSGVAQGRQRWPSIPAADSVRRCAVSIATPTCLRCAVSLDVESAIGASSQVLMVHCRCNH